MPRLLYAFAYTAVGAAHVAEENDPWIYNISATNKKVDSQVEIL